MACAPGQECFAILHLRILLTKLQCRIADLQWTAECQEAFDALKSALCEAPVLAIPDLNKRFEVSCDASSLGLGAVLAQEGWPVAFQSKALTRAEVNYPVGEQEFLAIVHACERWRYYVLKEMSSQLSLITVPTISLTPSSGGQARLTR